MPDDKSAATGVTAVVAFSGMRPDAATLLPAQHVGHVADKLPEFWATQATPYFAAAACSIASRLNTYDHCLAKLPAEAISSIHKLAHRVLTGTVLSMTIPSSWRLR
jgi:hypothetical protein